MKKSLLDNISLYSYRPIFSDAWQNGKKGALIDIENNCIFFFIEAINDEDLNQKLKSKNRIYENHLIAYGIIGFWLKYKNNSITTVFNDYYNMRKEQFLKAHEKDVDAWKRDLEMEFSCFYHIPKEKIYIKESEELFEYITQSDQNDIKNLTDNYLQFARLKRKEKYSNKHPENKIIEGTFLDAYHSGGPACECMEWFRTEYNLPYIGPHWLKEGKTEKEKLSGRSKDFFEKDIPEEVAEEFEDFDDSVLYIPERGLMEEINNNIENCNTQDKKIQYLTLLLQPFKEFAAAFYDKAQMDDRERYIINLKNNIKKLKEIPDDAIDERTGEPIRPKDQVASCLEIIEKCKKDITYCKKVQDEFFWFAQHGLGAGQYRNFPVEVNDEMCKYLGGWWKYMIDFARRLAALALFHGINLKDVQETCEVYLISNFTITDYVDDYFITSTEHARKLLAMIEANKQKNEHNYISDPNHNKNNEEVKTIHKTNKNKSSKPEKLHGVEYPVFSKGSGVTDNHIKALYLQLTSRGWISTKTKLIDFQDLFSGNSNKCEIIWLGQDKIGNNEPTVLGVSALYVLFKKMADEKLITTGTKSERVGPIIETHFVDSEGRFLTSVSNSNKISQIANDCINKILIIMRTRPGSEDIQQLLREEMQSTYDKEDRQDMGYRKPH